MYSLVDAPYPHLMLIPMVSFLILDSLHRELVLAQTFVTSGVPCPPACWPAALGFAKVDAKYPLQILHRSGALGAIAFPVPPTAAFFVNTKGSW